MANVKKELRVSDVDIKRLNHVGLGLKAIATNLGCHAATINLRLKAMGLNPTDTRRSFMEQVFLNMTRDEQDWLSHNLFNAGISAKKFIADLIKEAYAQASKNTHTATPVAMPVMDTLDTVEEPEPIHDETAAPVPTEKKKLNFGQ